MARLKSQCADIDRAMAHPAGSLSPPANNDIGELLIERAKASNEIERLEDEWLALSERLKRAG